MADDLLLASIDIAAADLDTAASAWVVVLGRLVDADLGTPIEKGEVEDLIARAKQSAGFPLGPISYVTGAPVSELRPSYDTVIYRAERDGQPYIDALVGAGPAAFVAVGGTRHGWLGSGPPEPSHILCSDVEAYLSDLIGLLGTRAEQLGYRGTARIAIAVRSEVPGAPLRLRSLDESTGEVAPVRDDLDHFDVVEFDIEIDVAHLGEVEFFLEMHQCAWDAALRVVAQFGLERPQLIPEPGTLGGDLTYG